MTDADRTSDELLRQAASGDSVAVGELLTRFRERLVRLVTFRMDRRLRKRIEATDVVQDASLEVVARLAEYFDQPESKRLPFYVWLRYLALQRVAYLQRYHLGTLARDAAREVSLQVGPWPDASSIELAHQLLGRFTSPSQAAARAEMKQQIEFALEKLDHADREIIALRHFEQLSNHECAAVLQLSRTAASNRYVRAIKRLKQLLDQACPANQSTQGDH